MNGLNPPRNKKGLSKKKSYKEMDVSEIYDEIISLEKTRNQLTDKVIWLNSSITVATNYMYNKIANIQLDKMLVKKPTEE